VVGKETAVKKYVVRLNAEERGQLDELIRKSKHSAQLLTKARILLKADVSELGDRLLVPVCDDVQRSRTDTPAGPRLWNVWASEDFVTPFGAYSAFAGVLAKSKLCFRALIP
jgi:hypothetical protein